MTTISYPFFRAMMIGSVAGSFFGPATRNIGGSTSNTPSPNIGETLLPFNGSWNSCKYVNIQENSAGSFFLQRKINNTLVVNSLTTYLQESQNTKLDEPDSPNPGITAPFDGATHNWLDTNLAGAFDPIATGGSDWVFDDNDFGFGDITP